MVINGLAGLGQLLFWVCVISSQMAGVTIGRFQIAQTFTQFSGAHPFLASFIFQVFTAMACFLIFYMVAVNVVALVEQRTAVAISRPTVRQGVIYSALIPFALCIIGFVIIKFLSHASIYG